jgi:hypothetical protein
LITTAGGVSRSRISSQTAMRRISRSMIAIRSGRQRSAVSAINGSIASMLATVSPASAVANSRTSSGAPPTSGHCRSNSVSAAMPTCDRPISH